MIFRRFGICLIFILFSSSVFAGLLVPDITQEAWDLREEFIKKQGNHNEQVLIDGRYKEMEARLDELVNASLQPPYPEIKLYSYLSVFRQTELVFLEPYLKKWVALSPEKYQPYLVRATYYRKLAWKHRTKKLSKDVKDFQWKSFSYYINLAEKDYLKVKELNPKVMPAYTGLVSIYMARNNTYSKFHDIFQQGLKVNPYSYKLHENYLWGLQPKWGGSKLEAVMELGRIKELSKENPRLKSLLGFMDFLRSSSPAARKDRKLRVKYLTNALSYGDNDYFYFKRAQAYYYLTDFEKARADIIKSMENYSLSFTRMQWYVYLKGEEPRKFMPRPKSEQYLTIGTHFMNEGDTAKARNYYELAAKHGNARAMSETGYHWSPEHEQEYGDPANIEKSLFYYNQALKFGYGNAGYSLASNYFRGIYGERDGAQAVYYLKKGAEVGDMSSIMRLGELYRWGDDLYGVEKDEVKARMWYCEAYKLGSERAKDYVEAESINCDAPDLKI